MGKIFTISNGNFYIAQFSTGLKPVRTKEEAIQFKTYDKANSFMLNMPKSFKNLGYHIEGKAEIVKTTQTQACPEVKSSEHKKVTIQRDLSYIKEIEDEISKLEFFISDLQRKRQDAIETVERCEREEQDFLHCSEGPDKNHLRYAPLDYGSLVRRIFIDSEVYNVDVNIVFTHCNELPVKLEELNNAIQGYFESNVHVYEQFSEKESFENLKNYFLRPLVKY